ncbi:hypothetical protein F441_16441 [Phytophthora nicotianae CJ01A1]|uniref:Uncharacterized protein n=1 Tax=Phytophthora nicotianae CJ01A1 TaxID=1317063 RepID=W2WCF2_PHYNI|nr:hypothetical protein F441_16441 [Phytophthora nicotianae CJ01A1]
MCAALVGGSEIGSSICPKCAKVSKANAAEYFAVALPVQAGELYKRDVGLLTLCPLPSNNVKHMTFANLTLGNNADEQTKDCEDPAYPGEEPPLLHGCRSLESDNDRGLKEKDPTPCEDASTTKEVAASRVVVVFEPR